MEWADYRSGSKKAKAHVGFDINRGIPRKIFLSDGKEGERPFVDKIIDKGETGVMDRGYQSHDHFDQWQAAEKFFVCRIREDTRKTVIRENAVNPDSIVVYDQIVLLGTKGINQSEKELRLVGYRIDGKDYWVATNRYDLTAEEVAQVYKLRWNRLVEASPQGISPDCQKRIRSHGSTAWWPHYLSATGHLLPGAAPGAGQHLQSTRITQSDCK